MMHEVHSILWLQVTLPSGEKHSIKFAILVVAAGAWSGEVGRLVGIGEGEGIMSVPIPIEPRYVATFLYWHLLYYLLHTDTLMQYSFIILANCHNSLPHV